MVFTEKIYGNDSRVHRSILPKISILAAERKNAYLEVFKNQKVSSTIKIRLNMSLGAYTSILSKMSTLSPGHDSLITEFLITKDLKAYLVIRG